MRTTTLERPQAQPVKAEQCHSCTSQCTNPCAAAASELTGPGIGSTVTGPMA